MKFNFTSQLNFPYKCTAPLRIYPFKSPKLSMEDSGVRTYLTLQVNFVLSSLVIPAVKHLSDVFLYFIGMYMLLITCCGMQIPGSPYKVNVQSTETEFLPVIVQRPYAYGQGLSLAQAGQVAKFTLEGVPCRLNVIELRFVGYFLHVGYLFYQATRILRWLVQLGK